jgi:trimeric autotransporter adhesin
MVGVGGSATGIVVLLLAVAAPSAGMRAFHAGWPTGTPGASSPAATINTVAGTETSNSCYGNAAGDGGSATAANLCQPSDVAALPNGGFLIADTGASRIREVSPGGRISTVAGTGKPGYGGDGGPATSARLNEPTGLAVLPDGGFLIADSANNRIREVSTSGTITTVAGTGAPDFSGDGGPATSATLQNPEGVAVAPRVAPGYEDGAFLIADSANDRIRMVSADGVISTFAGNGSYGYSGDGGDATSASLYYPTAVALIEPPSGPDGDPPNPNVLIADSENNRIRSVDGSTGIISTVAGDGVKGFGGDQGPAPSAELDTPTGIAVESDGSFLIADQLNQRVREVSAQGTITTVAGSGKDCQNQPRCGDGGPANAAGMGSVRSVAALPAGVGYLIADTGDDSVRRVTIQVPRPEARTITTVAGGGVADGTVPATSAAMSPTQVAALPGGAFLIADGYIEEVSATGWISVVAGGAPEPADARPQTLPTSVYLSAQGVAVRPNGAWLIADTGVNRVDQVANGNFSGLAGTGTKTPCAPMPLPATQDDLNGPTAVAALPDGGALFAEPDDNRIREVSASGALTEVAGEACIKGTAGDGGPAASAELNGPSDVAALPGGGYLIADTGNDTIREVSPSGVITTVAGQPGAQGDSGDGGPATSARLNRPQGVAPLADGGFLIADTLNEEVRKVSAAGVITTVAGIAGSFGFGGDGGPATSAYLNRPTGVAPLPDGGFLIADSDNYRIREVWGQVQPPKTHITSTVVNSTHRRATFKFTGSGDVRLGFQCKLDEGPFRTCTSPATYRRLVVGIHTFRVRATSTTSGVDPSPAQTTIRLLATPSTRITKTAVDSTKRRVTFSFTGSGAKPLGFQCRLDKEAFRRCTSPTTYRGLTTGKHTFKVRATETPNDRDPTAAKKEFTITKH